MFEYSVIAQDGKARVGELVTPHGTVRTPMFMPVGTHGAVKGVSAAELKEVGSQTILANTYHMYLRPGDELVHTLGGLHSFMGWDGPILTDSGGFQVFSLGERGISGSEKQALRQVAEEGITFYSHLDGSRHLFTPEKSIAVQQNLGADIIMAFDQPVYGMATVNAAGEAMERSMRWLDRSVDQWKRGDTEKQALFGIVQGGLYTDLHRRSAEIVANYDLPGNAIGGLAIGNEGISAWAAAVASVNEILPVGKPRYVMGIGDGPYDLIAATESGADMYDCVSPTRLARHGVVWQTVGEKDVVDAFWRQDTEALLALGKSLQFERWNLLNAQYKDDPRSLTEGAKGIMALSRATLRHYLKEQEMVGYRVLSMHNIALLHTVTRHLDWAICHGEMSAFLALVTKFPSKKR